MNRPLFSPGFRLSTIDVCVLLVGAICCYFGVKVAWWLGSVVAFTVGHFFLFCNVFRMPRPLELAWATLFVSLSASTVATQVPGWPISFGVSLAGTVAVVAFQMRQPSYHGIGWKKINPGLPEWWQARHEKA